MMHRGTSGVPVRARVASTERKGGALARAAGQLCGNSLFQAWVVARAGAAPQGVSKLDHAAEYVRCACGIPSRRDLDHNAQAATWYRERILRPFNEWKRRHVAH